MVTTRLAKRMPLGGVAERSVQILAEDLPTRRAPLSDFAPKTQTGVLHLFGLSDVHVPPGLCRRPVDRIDEMGA